MKPSRRGRGDSGPGEQEPSPQESKTPPQGAGGLELGETPRSNGNGHNFDFHRFAEMLTPRLEQFEAMREQAEAIREEVATLEIPAPVHYPPAPPFQYECFDFTHDSDESEVGTPAPTPLMMPSMPLPPRPPTRHLEFAPGALPTSFSFACGGWLQFYMFGVAKCLKEHGLHRQAKFSGCSAGALTALGMCIEPSSFDKAVEYCKAVCIPQCRGTLLGPFLLHKYVRGCLEYSGCLDEFWEHTKGRLHVAVTSLPDFRAVRVNDFSDKEDLIAALLASAAAFPMAPPVRRRGKWLIDGGISDFQPTLEERTVTVNPFYFSQADIRPSRYVPAWWSLLPPSHAGTVDWLFDLGYCDALRWMRSANLEQACAGRCRRDPADPLSCKHRPAREPHPFDQSTRSFRRFFGYGQWPFLFDLLTMVLVETVWRTTAYALIYSELFLKLLYVGSSALLREAFAMRWALLVGGVLLAPSLAHMGAALACIVACKLCMDGSAGAREWRIALELAASLLSVSLFLRSLPIVGTRIHLRKHHKLFRQSLMYRVMVHII